MSKVTFEDVIQASREARATISNSDLMIRNLAHLMRGRLRLSGISHSTLCELKQELTRYNMQTGAWKE